jgi:hypothetical protein
MPIPLPTFWPEKATEWVALIGGTVGGVLGSFGFILSILNYRRDRAKIRLRFRPHMHVTAPGYEPNQNYLVLQIFNEGRREVQISRADGNYYRGDGFTFTDPIVRGAPVLSEKSPEATFFLKEDSFNLQDIWYFSVAAPVRESRVYVDRVPKRWWRALQMWPTRLRLRREIRARRAKRLETDEVLVGKVPTKPSGS